MKNDWKCSAEERAHKDDGWLQNLLVAHQRGVAHDRRRVNTKHHLTTAMEEVTKALTWQVKVTWHSDRNSKMGLRKCPEETAGATAEHATF